MFQKDLNLGLLLDFYGDLLSKMQNRVLDLYYNDDLSLAEISDCVGISRQGVRSAIKKGEEILKNTEEKLKLAARFSEMNADSDRIGNRLRAIAERETDPEIREELIRLIEEISVLARL